MGKMQDKIRERGYNVKQLVEVSRVSRSTIYKIDNGHTNVDKAILERLALILKCDPNELLANNTCTPKIKEEPKEKIIMQCLNENCLLNKNKLCDNDVVLEGRGSCEGRYKVQPSQAFSPTTRFLFANK